MSEFPDGLFRPQQSVTKLEFILTVVRALRLDLDQSTSELPFRDVPSNHWSAKFIRTALREGIIKPDTTLNPNSSLVLSDFMTLAQGISVVRKTLATTSENLAPVPVATRNVEAFLYPIILAIKDQKPRVPAIQKSIQFSSPKTNDVTLGDFVRFEGVILPSEPFNIGSFQVVPSPDGRFVCAVPLVLGKNDFSATVFNTTSTFHLFRLQPYDDLKGHWSEMTAAKLRFLRVLDDEQAFKPNKVITREEFVVWLSRALDWPMEPVEVPRIPSDLDKTSQNYLAYLKALQLGVVSVDERGLFRPKATMNKAELITALTQAVPLQLFPVAYTGPFPFADVSSKHWARTSVEQGLKTGLIAPSPMFSPRHEVTRAELAMMLYRLPSVQTRLDSAISHD
jgi:hypothetical protein